MLLMSKVDEFFRMAPPRRDHIPAFRIAVGVALPLLTLLILNRLDLAVYATFGSFTGIYARHESRRSRFLRQSFAGAMITVCIGIGATLGLFHANTWTIMLVSSLVSAVTATIAVRFNLKPAGSVFFIFATAAIGGIEHGATPPMAMLVSFLSAGVCVVLGAFTHLIGEGSLPDTTPLVTKHYQMRDLVGHCVRYFISPFLAGSIGILSINVLPVLSHPYWAMVASVAPLISPQRLARILRCFHRIIGTLGGIVVAAFLLSFPTEPWQLVVWIIVLQFAGELFIARNYSMGMLFITPMALMMTQLASNFPATEMLVARAVETAIGAFVALGVVAWGYPAEHQPCIVRQVRSLTREDILHLQLPGIARK